MAYEDPVSKWIKCNCDVVERSGYVIMGNHNRVFGDDNIVIGDTNFIVGSNNVIKGVNNTVEAGEDNTCVGQYNTAEHTKTPLVITVQGRAEHDENCLVVGCEGNQYRPCAPFYCDFSMNEGTNLVLEREPRNALVLARNAFVNMHAKRKRLEGTRLLPYNLRKRAREAPASKPLYSCEYVDGMVYPRERPIDLEFPDFD